MVLASHLCNETVIHLIAKWERHYFLYLIIGKRESLWDFSLIARNLQRKKNGSNLMSYELIWL